MLQPIKNALNTKNLRKATKSEEVRRMGHAASRSATRAWERVVVVKGRTKTQPSAGM